MAVIGFKFDTIHIEKKAVPSGEINISNNVKLTEISEAKINVGGEHKALKVDFEYTVNYKPDIGDLKLTGNLVYMDDKAKQDSVLKAWKEKKVLDNKFSLSVTNKIMAKCNIKAIELCSEVNLPSHISLPVAKAATPISAKKDTKNYIG